MLKNLFNRFCAPKSQPRPRVESLRLYKKDDKYFADPTNTREIDDFEFHSEIAGKLNSYQSMVDSLRSTVGPLEGSEHDLNERPDVVAVNDFPMGEKTVDAAITTRGSQGHLGELSANVSDSTGMVSIKENRSQYSNYQNFADAQVKLGVENAYDEDYIKVRVEHR